PNDKSLHPRYRWSARLIRLASLLSPRPVPAIQHVPTAEPGPILEWMTAVRRADRTPHLHTFASAAVRVCQAALERGVELRGAQFTLIGEPTSAARLAVLERVGGYGVPIYGITEVGPLAHGCLRRSSPSELHLNEDRIAVIQARDAGGVGGLPERALLLSTLR